MLFNGDPIRAAIGADMFVAKNARSSMAGVALLKKFLNGPQDVSVCDIANEKTRRLWERMGGFIAPSYNLNWVAVLRPCQLAAALVREQKTFRIPGDAAVRMAPLIDRFVPDRFTCRVDPVSHGLFAETLSPAEFCDGIGDLTSDETVQPIMNLRGANWMWRRLRYLSPEAGDVTAVLLKNSRGARVGWYIYKLHQGGVARMIQIAARTAHRDAVINHLFSRARDEGAAAVAGRVQPGQLQTLIDRGCLLRGRTSYALVHSRDKGIRAAYQSGKAWLSVLEGEATMNVWNRPEQAALDRGLPAGFPQLSVMAASQSKQQQHGRSRI